ncbi:GNAT family N-acetyltransferase [Acidobacteria bacterium AB60]|nr:GNAT family N-acetyltransferase [Acidobacteria bacterium AB60]
MPPAPQIKVGPLKKGELPEADRLFRLAFGTFLGLPDPATFMGDRDLVASRVRAKHVQALAAREHGRLVGFNLLTIWGSFGFFGPLCVSPEYWDKGVAQKLLEATVAAFDQAKLPRTALYTFPHSAKHVGLYTKYGYWPQQLTALFRYAPVKPRDWQPEPGTSVLHITKRWHRTHDDHLEDCRKLTQRIDPGLDLTQEIRSLLNQDIGEILLTFTRKTFDGFAIACTGKGSEGGAGVCYLKFAAVRGGSGADERFHRLLDACEAFAASRNVLLEFGASFACEKAYRCLLSRRLRPLTHGITMQRPHAPGFYRRDAYVRCDLR